MHVMVHSQSHHCAREFRVVSRGCNCAYTVCAQVFVGSVMGKNFRSRHIIISDHVRMFPLDRGRHSWLSQCQSTRYLRGTQPLLSRTVFVCVINVVLGIWKARTLVVKRRRPSACTQPGKSTVNLQGIKILTYLHERDRPPTTSEVAGCNCSLTLQSVSFQPSVCPISEFAPPLSRFQSVLECFTWQ